jgi:hypothetical protein
MTTRVIVLLLMLFCAALPSDVYSQRSQSTVPVFQTNAVFELAVQKSPVFKTGQSRLEAQSVSVTYTNEFLSGEMKALKVEFFTKQVGSATLVLFLDQQDRIGQANLTYVMPGITVTRTVAGRREEVTKYFSDYRFDRKRLRLMSKGSYKTEPDSKDEIFTLSWDLAVDIPVYDRIQK